MVSSLRLGLPLLVGEGEGNLVPWKQKKRDWYKQGGYESVMFVDATHSKELITTFESDCSDYRTIWGFYGNGCKCKYSNVNDGNVRFVN